MPNRLKTWYLWTAAGATAILIILTVPFARPVQKMIESRLGTGVFIGIPILFILVGIFLFWRWVWQSDQRWLQLVFFSAVTGLYAWRISSLTIAVERFHLLEYGLLAVLVTEACYRLDMGRIALGYGLAAVHAIGMGDEFFQWLWPDRYGEWRDVMINMQSAGLALLAFALLSPRSDIWKPSRRRQWAVFFIICALLSILSGLFFLNLQVFGNFNYDTDAGAFKSFFSMDELLRTTPNAYQAFLEFITKNEDPELLEKKYWYEREGKEHFDRAHLLFEQQRFEEAAREYIIYRRYFSGFEANLNMHFSPAISRKLGRIIPDRDTDFLSRIADWMVTDLTHTQVYTIVSCLTGMFFLGAVWLFLKRPD
ncbi:VanZ family protein [bacterium]|nr:VanZ family protein [candidate division CSSED10-310 bacterium]